MAVTYVDICNAALTRIGLPIISSFNDGTTQANACANRWKSDRDIVLRMHPWTCATKRVILAPATAAPAFDYLYQFPMPADYLRILQVAGDPMGSGLAEGDSWSPGFGGFDTQRYKIESGNILFDSATLYLIYVAEVENAEQLDPECQNAMALYIAYDLAQLLFQNENLVMQLNKEFEAAMATARNVNAQEQQSCMVIDQFERARRWGPS